MIIEDYLETVSAISFLLFSCFYTLFFYIVRMSEYKYIRIVCFLAIRYKVLFTQMKSFFMQTMNFNDTISKPDLESYVMTIGVLCLKYKTQASESDARVYQLYTLN